MKSALAMPPFVLIPLEEADVSRCVSSYFSAFRNAHSLACWPRTPNVRRWWENMIRDELNEEGSFWLKAVTNDGNVNEHDEIVGFVKWQAPKPGVEPSTDLPAWPIGADEALCNETFGSWGKKHREWMQSRGHWYLEIVATDPTYQGHGAGSKLIQEGLDRADAEKVECYLEASPHAAPLYEKLGFKEVDHSDVWVDNERVKETWYRTVFMVRPPLAGNTNVSF